MENRWHIEFDVEGDLSLLMHHILTLGEQHWKVVGGEEGVSITAVGFLQSVLKSLGNIPEEIATAEDKEKIMAFAKELEETHTNAA